VDTDSDIPSVAVAAPDWNQVETADWATDGHASLTRDRRLPTGSMPTRPAWGLSSTRGRPWQSPRRCDEALAGLKGAQGTLDELSAELQFGPATPAASG
jgi:hypothetical protein